MPAWYDDARSSMDISEVDQPVHPDLLKKAKRCFDCHNSKALFNANSVRAEFYRRAVEGKDATKQDQISVLCKLIRQDAIKNVHCVEEIVKMLSASDKRIAYELIDACFETIKNMLPSTRVLYYFRQRLADSCSQSKDPLSNEYKEKLALWYGEEQIKLNYCKFLKALEKLLLTDSITKSLVVDKLFDLLEKPEGRKTIFCVLVNKLGDVDKTFAVSVTSRLRSAVFANRLLIPALAEELCHFAFRPNLSPSAQAAAVLLLSRLPLRKFQKSKGSSPEDEKLGSLITTTYIKLFEAVSSTPTLPSSLDASENKMMKGILSGISHCLSQYNSLHSEMEKHLDFLCKAVHTSCFSVAVEALYVVWQFALKDSNIKNRFYQILYEKMADREILWSKATASFLSLLYKACRSDHSVERTRAIVKRLLQICLIHTSSAFVCASLLHISWISSRHKDLLQSDVRQKKRKIKNKKSTEAQFVGSNRSEKYEPLARNPLFAGAFYEPLYELEALKHHVHPTVRTFALSISQNEKIEYSSNCFEDFAPSKFLDRFISKKAKKEIKDGVKNNKEELDESSNSEASDTESEGNEKENETKKTGSKRLRKLPNFFKRKKVKVAGISNNKNCGV